MNVDRIADRVARSMTAVLTDKDIKKFEREVLRNIKKNLKDGDYYSTYSEKDLKEDILNDLNDKFLFSHDEEPDRKEKNRIEKELQKAVKRVFDQVWEDVQMHHEYEIAEYAVAPAYMSKIENALDRLGIGYDQTSWNDGDAMMTLTGPLGALMKFFKGDGWSEADVREQAKKASMSFTARNIEVDIDVRDVDKAAKELERLGVQIKKKGRGQLLFEVPSFARRKVKRWMEKNGYGKKSDYPELYPKLFASEAKSILAVAREILSYVGYIVTVRVGGGDDGLFYDLEFSGNDGTDREMERELDEIIKKVSRDLKKVGWEIEAEGWTDFTGELSVGPVWGIDPDTMKVRASSKDVQKIMAKVLKDHGSPRLRIPKVAGDLESTLDGMRNDKARRHVSDLLRKVTKGRFRDENWRPIQQVRKVFDSMGFDVDEPAPSRYWADKFWQQQLKSIDGANSPDNHKGWEMEINFTNDKGRPTTIYVKLIANAIGSVQAGGDVWEVYDIDYSAY
jgi:hypothetical protein